MLKTIYPVNVFHQRAWKMKDILLINNKAKGTGIGTYSYNLYDTLKTMSKRKIDFLTLKAHSKENDNSVIGAVPQKIKKLLDHLNFMRSISRSYRLYHILNPNLGMLLSRLRPSVVTVHDLAALVHSVSRQVILQSYGLDIPLLLAMEVNMRFVKSADRIICMSHHTKKDLVSLLGIDQRRIVAVYPGIDRLLFRPRDKLKARQSLKLPLNRQILLHVGTDEPRKNSKTLIEAFSLVKRKFPNAVLVKVGDMRGTTRRLIVTLGLEDAVIHYKKVADVATFYNAADLFVFPSYYEGFGYPAAEAMASGCPVIAGNSSSVTEVVGRGGLLFPPFDVVALREIIERALADQNMRSVMRQEGFEQAKQFDWNKCAEKTLETYNTL